MPLLLPAETACGGGSHAWHRRDQTWLWRDCLDHRRIRRCQHCRRSLTRRCSQRTSRRSADVSRSRILARILPSLCLPALVLPWLALSGRVLIGNVALACGCLCLTAVRLRTLVHFCRWINHWKHVNLRGIGRRIRNVPCRGKFVLVTRLSKAVMLRHSLRQRGWWWVQPVPCRMHSAAIEHLQGVPGSGHRRKNDAGNR